MATNDLPLSTLPGFRTASLDVLAAELAARLSASVIRQLDRDLPLDARVGRLDLPLTALWCCSYRSPLRLQFPEQSVLRVQLQRRGIGATRTGRDVVAVSGEQAAVSSSAAEVDFGSDFVQLAWRVPVSALQGKLQALIEAPVGRPLEFDPALNLAAPRSRAMMTVLESLLQIADTGLSHAAKLVCVELESALLVSFLYAAGHNYRDRLERDSPAAAPWQVRRAESFIEANWDQPITVEDIVTASGTSARSVFRAFRQTRDYTPLQFLKHVRLQHARRLLQDPASSLSVTEVALLCGFSDISNFSKDFSRAFQAPPSQVLRARPPSASGRR